MSRRYPKEVHQFIADNVQGITTRELVALVNERFDLGFTESSMKAYKTNHKLKSGTKRGSPSGTSKLFPEHIRNYIQDHYVGCGHGDMAIRLNARFGTSYTKEQIKAYYGRAKLNSGLTGRFERGHIPQNKGKKGVCAPGCEKGWFSRGHEPINKTPVGTIHKRSDGYLWEKYGPGPLDWKPHHQLVWERANGPQPDGCVVILKDGNRDNCELENLMLVTMAESLELTRSKLRSSDPDLTETGVLIVKVKRARFDRKKKMKGAKRGKAIP